MFCSVLKEDMFQVMQVKLKFKCENHSHADGKNISIRQCLNNATTIIKCLQQIYLKNKSANLLLFFKIYFVFIGFQKGIHEMKYFIKIQIIMKISKVYKLIISFRIAFYWK